MRLKPSDPRSLGIENLSPWHLKGPLKKKQAEQPQSHRVISRNLSLCAVLQAEQPLPQSRTAAGGSGGLPAPKWCHAHLP